MDDLQNNDFESVEIPKGSVARKKKRPLKTSDIIVLVIVIVAIGVFAFAMYQLISRWVDSSASRDNYKEAESNYTETREDSTGSGETITDSSGESYVRLVEPSYSSIDWDSLAKESDNRVVGWVEVPTCGISYPIVQGTDNEYYLTHSYNNKFSYSGAVFLHSNLGSDWKNYHEIVYGHNMKDGSIFGSLLVYDEEEFYKRNEGKNFFFIYTPNNILVYQIFCVCDVTIDENPTAYKINITSDFTIADYADYVIEHGLYDTGITVTDEQVTTLFTCQADYTSKERHMVHGKLVETLSYE